MKIKPLLLLVAAVIMVSCANRKKDDLSSIITEPDPGEIILSEEAMLEVIENIASPIEVASLLSDLDVPFSVSYLSDPDQMSNFAPQHEMAFNLGVLSSDLGYLNMYNKTGSAINYLSTINKLTEALNVGQFFDFVKMKRLATSENTLDSLLFVSMNSFNMMDAYLKETNRGNLSALMVAGVWLEGLYLATQVYQKSAVEEIREVIGQQKTILTDLLIILENYATDDYFKSILVDFRELRTAYDAVKITYEIGEPKTVEVDGMLMVIQDESSTIDISESTIKEITGLTNRIRTKLLNN